MDIKRRISQFTLRKFRFLGIVIAGVMLFGGAYSQSPLYTSNQNQYFLHGLAAAGFGFLKADWLANTTDPTPVYSLLVRWSYQLFKSEIPFYFYYFLILGVYFICLMGIVRGIIEDQAPLKLALIATSIIIIHSAGWRYLMTIGLGPEWTYLFEGGLANQRLLGAVFQPSTFGVFLLASIYAFVLGKNWLGIFLIPPAIYFHPTYLVAGGILVLAYLTSDFYEHRSLMRISKYGSASLGLVSPVLYYVLTFLRENSAVVVSRAQYVLAHYRIPHHAIIEEWFDLTSVIQIIIVILAIKILRNRSPRLHSILLVSALVIALFIVVQLFIASDMLALVFPWRLSTVLVPVATSVTITHAIDTSWKHIEIYLKKHQKVMLIFIGGLLGTLFVAGIARFQIEMSQQKNSPESGLIKFVDMEKKPGDVYLIPPKMQDFRLASGAPIYIDFKSIPYRPDEVLEWYRRITIINEFYGSSFPECDQFTIWTLVEKVNHVVLSPDSNLRSCPDWEIIYEDQHYSLLRRTQ